MTFRELSWWEKRAAELVELRKKGGMEDG